MSLYEDLDIDKTATTEEIKTAYKKKAKETHPDLGGNEEEFKKVNHAHRVLTNEKLRIQYDATGREEELTEDRIEKEAISLLTQLMFTVISHEKDKTIYMDVLVEMRKTINKVISDNQQKVRVLDSVITNLEEIKKCFLKKDKRNRKRNFFVEALEQNIRSTKAETLHYGEEITICEKAIAISKDFIFKKKEKEKEMSIYDFERDLTNIIKRGF